jgi:hypothetical protein
MSLLDFVAKLPLVVFGLVGIVNKVKGADKGAKVDAVLQAIPESLSLAEFAAGKDLLNDTEVAGFLKALVDAEHAAQDARDALKAILVKKGSK